MLRTTLASQVRSLFLKPKRRKGYRNFGSENLEPRILLSATDIDDNGSFALADANFADEPLELTAGDTQAVAGTVNRTDDKIDGLKFKVAADAGSVIGTITVNAAADAGQSYTVTLYNSSRGVVKSQVVKSTTADGTSVSVALAAGKVYYIGIVATSGTGDIDYDLTASLTEFDADHNGSFALADANFAEDPLELTGGDTQVLAGTVNKTTDTTDGLKFKVAADAGSVIGTITVNAAADAGQSYTVTLYNSSRVAVKSQVVKSTTAADTSVSVALTAGKVYYIGIVATSGTGDIAYDLTASVAAD